MNRTETMLVVPAYGRQYRDDANEQVIKDWNSGKDFKIPEGPYLSKDDQHMLHDEGISEIHVYGVPLNNVNYGLLAVIELEPRINEQ